MKKSLVIPLLITTLLVLLACSISYEGVVFTDDEELNKQKEHEELVQFLATASENQTTPEPQPNIQPDPVNEPVIPTASDTGSIAEGMNEYSVTSTNFNCICQETGTVTQELKFTGDQLELNGQIYDKVNDNTYKRSYMGYYILVSGDGDQKTETRVDEERSVVIILTDTGYVMEHYQGSDSSPCCFHTFFKND